MVAGSVEKAFTILYKLNSEKKCFSGLVVKNVWGQSVFLKLCPALKKHTESLQNLLVCHFGLLPLAVSVAIHCVGRVLRLNL